MREIYIVNRKQMFIQFCSTKKKKKKNSPDYIIHIPIKYGEIFKGH